MNNKPDSPPQSPAATATPEPQIEPECLPDSFYQETADKCHQYAEKFPSNIARGLIGTVIEEACKRHSSLTQSMLNAVTEKARRLEQEKSDQSMMVLVPVEEHDKWEQQLAAVTRERDELHRQIERDSEQLLENANTLLVLRRDRDGLAALCAIRMEALEKARATIQIEPMHPDQHAWMLKNCRESIADALALTPEQALQRKEGGR